jgi:DNA modification methylase
MINWKLQSIPLKSIVPTLKNPRKIDKNQLSHLENLISKFGLIDKPILNSDFTLIGGHQRLKILKKMKVKEVECWIPDQQLSQEDLNHLCIGLNLNQGKWDYDILANEWNMIDLIKWGFSEEQLVGLTKESEQISQVLEEDSEVLEPCKDEDAITKLGDIYELNNHRLVCGDSTVSEYVDKCLNGNKPILMVTDPPYGVNYDPSWRKRCQRKIGVSSTALGKVQNDHQVNWEFAWNLFPGSVVYIWCASWFLPEIAKSLDDFDYERKSLIIWKKQHFALSRGHYHWQHEPCWYAVKKGHQHNWQGSRKESTVWEIANLNCFGKSQQEDERTAHSTQKPLECMARPIRNSSAIGEGVYDPFLGSGTTLIAAESLNRTCYGIEISPAYCDIIVARYIRFMDKNNREFIIKKNGNVISKLHYLK